MTDPIPAAIVQQAETTIAAMTERGLKDPHKLTSTCRSIAVVLVAKWDSADKKAIRILTNIMVAKAHQITETL
jgi:hypothetical protein